ncbi:MAG: response regulator transcription factor [Gammaproteobacteria bacterium]|nr:response regulator transcription factor [Gammaproteobacteria bacterium]
MFTAKKLIIADDHPLFRDALKHGIASALGKPEIIVCGSFSELQKTINHHDDSDLILLDLHMPGAVGFSALHFLGLRCPDIPVTIVSANEDPEVVARAVDQGASGFIPKSADIAVIVEAIKQILEGQRWLPSDVRQRVSEIRLRSADIADKLATLTPSQFRVLMMLVDGRKNKEIADEICVTEATIKAHLTEIFKKLDVSNRTQAAMLAANYLEVDNPNTLS